MVAAARERLCGVPLVPAGLSSWGIVWIGALTPGS